MIAVVDYGAGNLFSVCNALRYLGLAHTVTADEQALRTADGILLPGVGAFPDAARRLRPLMPVLRQEAQRKPFLGICLGMQLLFERGYEFEETEGLGLIGGTVERLQAPGLKIPHMGWNSLDIHRPSPLLQEIDDGAYVYFVHSYAAVSAEEDTVATAAYGQPVPALVQRGQVFGAQFHPEKSGEVGLQILKNFGRCCG